MVDLKEMLSEDDKSFEKSAGMPRGLSGLMSSTDRIGGLDL